METRKDVKHGGAEMGGFGGFGGATAPEKVRLPRDFHTYGGTAS